jgi:hypothetical protein
VYLISNFKKPKNKLLVTNYKKLVHLENLFQKFF